VTEFFFKYPAETFEAGRLVLASAWPMWMFWTLACAASILLAAFLISRRSAMAIPKVATVWLLQTTVAVAVLILLWQPALEVERLKSRANAVAVLLDRSRSMAMPEGEGSRLSVASAAMNEALLPRLRPTYDLHLYAFDEALEQIESTQALTPTGEHSAVTGALTSALDELKSVPLGAIVLVSDGADNASPSESLLDVAAYGVPVHTVGVGPDRLTDDLELASLELPITALPGSRITARAGVRHGGAGDTVLKVYAGEALVAARPIVLPKTPGIHVENVELEAGEPGIRDLRFSLEPLEGETLLGNNTRRALVEVPERRHRVLYLEGEPRWEFKFIRRALEGDASLELVTWLRTTQRKNYRQGVRSEDELAEGFPPDRAALFDYDALIIGSIGAPNFSPAQHALIRDFVGDRGGSLLLLAGREGLADGGWDVTSVADALPAELRRGGDSSYRGVEADVRLATAGRASLVCRLDPDPQRNRTLWAELPALGDFQSMGALKPGAVTLVEAIVDGRREPLLVSQHFGRGQAAILATASTWRWRMRLPADDSRHQRFWRQLVRSLASSAPEPLQLNLATDGQRASIEVAVRTTEHAPVNDARVRVIVTPQSGSPYEVEMARSSEGDGSYVGHFVPVSDENYRVDAEADVEGGSLGVATRHFRYAMGASEDFDAAQNRALLTDIASRSGGRYWSLDQMAEIPEAISFSPAGVTERELLSLWNMPIVFMVLVLLKGGEWLARRRWGAV
jgi:uncharacterized membrane protein